MAECRRDHGEQAGAVIRDDAELDVGVALREHADARRALLFWLSSTIQHLGLSISFAKINTEGERVADVFYVSDEAGGKILDEARIEELKQRILSTIARLESGGSS